VEFFAPTLDEYEVFHNVGAGDETVGDALSELEERRPRLGDQPLT
jgi:molybdopterin converting factor small subunit